MLRPVLHIALHFFVPAFVARWWFAERWKWAWLVMMSAMAVDLDHSLANPIYDPNRCGIGFHPLHSYPALVIYAALAMVAKTRLFGMGLIVHMVLDGIDCMWIALDQ